MLPTATRSHLIGAGLIIACCATSPASAETLEELDALIDASSDEQSGIAMAREQASRGELLEALATLERVSAENPKSREARLIHAIYLCRIDDKQGGMVELSKLKKKHYGEETLAEARRRCEEAGAP